MATCDLSQNSAQVETAPRRPGRRDLLSIAAAAVVAGMKAPADAIAGPFSFARTTDSGDDTKLLALIAEEQRLRDIGDALDENLQHLIRERSPEIRRDLHRLIEDDRLPEPMASVYAESARYIDAADEIAIRIEAMIPKTIAGVIALIEFSGAAYGNDAAQNALAGLREIAAKGGAA
jgi:hypothetical protein